MKWRKLFVSCLMILFIVSMLLPMTVAAAGVNTNGFTEPIITYRSHVQLQGWQDWVSNGTTSGTTGQSLRLEALNIELGEIGGGVEYRLYVKNLGWQNWVADGALSGTTSMSLQTEAVNVRLTGEAATLYDIYYRVHVQNYGWMDWAKNGFPAGTVGYDLRLEAIEIKLVAKGDPAPGRALIPFLENLFLTPSVNYRSYIQDIGWQDWAKNGATAGTTGQSLRQEALNITLNNAIGGIEYRTHIEYYGWQDWVANGVTSGSTGQSLRLEAVEIRLTGAAASVYDIYYRVHVTYYGWLDWAMNGSPAGTTGDSKRSEAIEIVLVAKGDPAPGPTTTSFISK